MRFTSLSEFDKYTFDRTRDNSTQKMNKADYYFRIFYYVDYDDKFREETHFSRVASSRYYV